MGKAKGVDTLTYARLREVLKYNQSTGDFIWLVDRHGGARAGDKAGHYEPKSNRILIGIDYRLYPASRLAWYYMTGEWPPRGLEIDHKDINSTNDRWDNLRLATHAQNTTNTRKRINNKTGFKGVYFDQERRKYASRITYNGKPYFLGRYDTPEEARDAYAAAAKRLFGEFARVD